MKRFLSLLLFAGALAHSADLATVRSVYMLPMSHGLDQYLANRLTNEHLFRVVTDPKLADAVFTDRIGEGFQAQMDDLLPPPPAPEKPKPEAPPKDAKDERKSPALAADTVNKATSPALNSAMGRGKGTIFLVDTKSRQVVWSAYDPPKNTNANEMDRIATSLVGRIKKDLHPADKK